MPKIQLQKLHLEIIGYENEVSLSECSEFVSRLIHILEVREIMRQQVEITSQVSDAKPGVTVSVVFLESNLVLHTWPENRFAELEISSCKPFNPDHVIMAFREFFIPFRLIKVALSEVPWTV